MGKKSKAARAKAKAGAAASSDAPPALGSGGGASGGAMVVSSGGSKSQKCVLCLRTVRPGKGSACPGCSLLYCWRCEKNEFDDCPNGTGCARPIRRCISCIGSSTMVKVLEEKEGENYCDGVNLSLIHISEPTRRS